MNNPFLGMNPWLEGEDWHDFHNTFATEISNQIIQQIAPKYKVFVEKYVVRTSLVDNEINIYYPDVGVSDNEVKEAILTYGSGSDSPFTAHDLTISINLPVEQKIPLVKIVDAKNREVITIIEILSPANKQGEGFITYQEKRKNILQSPVHLLEVDLLRRGKRVIIHPRVQAADYVVGLTKSGDAQTLLWLFDPLQPLPTIPVPLRPNDPPATLNLQTIFTDIFEKRQYGSYFDYREKAPAPALKASVKRHLEEWLSANK